MAWAEREGRCAGVEFLCGIFPSILRCSLWHRANDISQFGYGARTCIGKNISLLELTKLMPQLLHQIDFVPVYDGEWSIKTAWFVKQKYEVLVRLRDTAV
jgi:cytochrome P450